MPKIVNFHGTSFDISKVKSLILSKEPLHKNGIASTLTIECNSRPEYVYNPHSGTRELEFVKDSIVLVYHKWAEAKEAHVGLERIWSEFLGS